jgi:hypothetical protein
MVTATYAVAEKILHHLLPCSSTQVSGGSGYHSSPDWRLTTTGSDAMCASIAWTGTLLSASVPDQTLMGVGIATATPTMEVVRASTTEIFILG